MSKQLILGIDPSKSATGVCLWDVTLNRAYRSDVIEDMEAGKFSHWLHYNEILPAYMATMDERVPQIIAAYVETPILHMGKGKTRSDIIAVLWETLGMIEEGLAHWGVIGELLPPATWRKCLLGKNPAGGAWSKAQVLPHLRQMFPDVTREDELEACGIAKVGAMLWIESNQGETNDGKNE